MASRKAYISNLVRILRGRSSGCAEVRPQQTAFGPNDGFTFIEVMIVMGLLIAVASLGLFMSMETLRGGSFRNDRASAVSALQRARSLSMNNMCFGPDCDKDKRHGVHFDNSGMTIFQIDWDKAGYENRDDSVDEFVGFDSRSTGVPAENIIVFEHLSGNLVDATSTSVTITDGMGHESEIDVNIEGRIDWTN